ncbi:MGMT family protein [Georgenia sp. MJ206]
MVLETAAHVPPGRATTYGLIAEAVRLRTGRGAARHVGAVLSRSGQEVAWWRVVRADGTLPPALWARATPMYAREGTPLLAHRAAVDLARAVWDPVTDPVDPATDSEAGAHDA